MTESAAPRDPLLVVEGLSVAFRLRDGRQANAVEDVGFVVRRGETLGLVGESGSGKSVTALSVIGLITPPGRITAGRIHFDGRELTGLDDRSLSTIRGRHIGFIFQEPMVALDPVYTIGQQIEETLRVHGLARGAAARARAIELLEAVRIPDPSRRVRDYPHQLSGGLRQRAMIALALAAGPELVIADEPTTALDVTVQAEILELLTELRRSLGLALLLITHDLGVVARMSDRIAVMYAGRIVEHGPTHAVLASPAHPYTRALLDSIPGVKPGARLRAIPGLVPPLGQRPSGCAFRERCADRLPACEVRPECRLVGREHEAACHLHEIPR